MELLVAGIVGSVLLTGSAKFLDITLQSANIAKSILTENDFKATIANGLGSKGCASSQADALLKPDSLKTGTTKDDGIGEFKPEITLPGGIKKGDVFKNGIEVVKMELTGVAAESTRDFVVYYKKKNLGRLNAIDIDNCEAAPTLKTTGCFEHKCTVNYDTASKHCTGLISCHNIDEAVLTEVTNTVNRTVTEKLKASEYDCPSGQFAKGFDAQGEIECDTIPKKEDCGAGHVLQGFDPSSGNAICEPRCTSTQRMQELTVAGGATSYKCMSCSGGGASWQDANGAFSECICPSGKVKKKVI